MNKNYFLIALFSFAMLSLTAQEIDDDMESYTDGQPISGAHWTDWGCGGGPGCAIMSSSDQAHSGGLSGMIPGDGTTDAVLDLGNKIFDTWYLTFWMYVPSNQEAYFNFQGEVPIGAGEWTVGNIFFNQDLATPGEGLIDNSALGAVTFNFPHDQWFKVQANIDITAGISAATWEFNVNDVNVIPAGTAYTNSTFDPVTSLGGIDFFSISANNLYYLDDVYYDNTLSVGDFASKEFSAYPNPVNDILNIRANETISSVAIFNVLGQQVYQANIDATSSQIDMSQYKSGAYFVKVNINGTEGTVKVIR
ncbi:MAG: T9SS type A sorting domain-containing protein [Flavobacteriales bacterium]